MNNAKLNRTPFDCFVLLNAAGATAIRDQSVCTRPERVIQPDARDVFSSDDALPDGPKPTGFKRQSMSVSDQHASGVEANVKAPTSLSTERLVVCRPAPSLASHLCNPQRGTSPPLSSKPLSEAPDVDCFDDLREQTVARQDYSQPNEIRRRQRHHSQMLADW